MLVDGGSLSLKTGPDVEVSGDAIINNRKKKLIPSYELEIKGSWSGTYLCPQKSSESRDFFCS